VDLGKVATGMFLLKCRKRNLYAFVEHGWYRRQIRLAHGKLPKEINAVFEVQHKARRVLDLLGKIVPIPVYRPANCVDAVQRVHDFGREAEETVFSRGVDVDFDRLFLLGGRKCHELERNQLVPIVLDFLCWPSHVLLAHNMSIKGAVVIEVDAAREHDLFNLDVRQSDIFIEVISHCSGTGAHEPIETNLARPHILSEDFHTS